MAYATNLEVSIPMELRRSLQKNEAARRRDRHPVMGGLALLLFAGWLVGIGAGATAGGLVHFLPAAALIVLGIRLGASRAGV